MVKRGKKIREIIAATEMRINLFTRLSAVVRTPLMR